MCKEEKTEDSFAWRKKNVKRMDYCKECKTAYNKQWYQINKDDHKKRVIENNKEYRSIRRSVINDLKNVPCADCGNFYPPYVMDFDHLGDKEFNISKTGMGVSFDRLMKEVQKCDVVCSNCHRERTHQRLPI